MGRSVAWAVVAVCIVLGPAGLPAQEPAIQEPAIQEPSGREPAIREPAVREPAKTREGRVDAGGGVGLNAGQGGDTAFYFQFGLDYYFTDMISINPNFFLSAGGAFVFGFAPRARFTFDLPVEDLEAFADVGIGFIAGDDGILEFLFPFGGGLTYWFLDQHLGVGTDLDLAATSLGGYNFRVLWSVVNVRYRF